jgi:hypothetical protein
MKIHYYGNEYVMSSIHIPLLLLLIANARGEFR